MPQIKLATYCCLFVLLQVLGMVESSVRCYQCEKDWSHGLDRIDVASECAATNAEVVECELVCITATYENTGSENSNHKLIKGCSTPSTVCPVVENNRISKCDVCKEHLCNGAITKFSHKGNMYLLTILLSFCFSKRYL